MSDRRWYETDEEYTSRKRADDIGAAGGQALIYLAPLFILLYIVELMYRGLMHIFSYFWLYAAGFVFVMLLITKYCKKSKDAEGFSDAINKYKAFFIVFLVGFSILTLSVCIAFFGGWGILWAAIIVFGAAVYLKKSLRAEAIRIINKITRKNEEAKEK